jgi:hypothetical protein
MRKYVIPALIGSAVTAIFGPVLLPAVSRLMRPIVKTGIRTGITAYQAGVVKIEELRESLDDVIAEVRQETTPEE